jgi:Protein of unknown function (DUF1553)/Protein of unknown function (DUF1549)/Concanavalin A-like lectin/glucanases superfamily
MRFAVCFLALSIPLLSVKGEEPKRAGADWWSLKPVAVGQPPKVERAMHPIDSFIRAKLAERGLSPAKEADRRTLIRRVTFDLTGLPPTPKEIDAFLADTSPKAFETLVDRLLASPDYGERWARHWLDIVRFSESHGFEYDRLRNNAWHYRDYVIESFNADRPYADFVREQLAGDQLPAGVVAATGILVAGPFDQAGSSSASAVVRGRAREDYLEDVVGTVSQTFLGVTLNCARCHDHKVDPYSAADYYRFKAVFDGVVAGERDVLPQAERNLVAEKQAVLLRESNFARLQLAALEDTAIARAKEKSGLPLSPVPQPIHRWSFNGDGTDSVGKSPLVLQGGAKIADGHLKLNGKDAYAVSNFLPTAVREKTLETWVRLATLDQAGGGALGLQTTSGGLFDSIVYAERQVRRWMAGSEFYGRTKPVDPKDILPEANRWMHVAIVYPGDGSIRIHYDGKPYGDAYRPEKPSPVDFKAGTTQAILGLRHTGAGNGYLYGDIDEARLYDFALTPEQIAESFRAGPNAPSGAERRANMTDDERNEARKLDAELARIAKAIANLQRPTIGYTLSPKQPGVSVLYKRGDFEKPGDAVVPASPDVVTGPPKLTLPADAAEGDRRRQFAEWIVHRDNPLTWRVVVNRVWQHHFGDGLVRTPNDFGLNGERPSHPELLDWLADYFRSSGGRMKELHRLIVLSETYRQATTPNPDASKIDADNRLLWRYSPRRLEGEAVRDAMLSVSAKLNPQRGGPSFKPFTIRNFNSDFYTPFDEDRPEFNRRSVYRMNVNSAKDAVLDVLDCPDPSVKTPRRPATTTPLQALTLMNGDFSNRMVRAFEARLSYEAPADADRQISLAYQYALGRLPTEPEVTRAKAALPAAGLRGLCWALLNSNEFLYLR